MQKLFILTLCLTLLYACGSNKAKKDFDDDQFKIEEIAKNKFTRAHKVIPNFNKRYSIVLSKNKSLKELIPTVDFFIFDHEENEIIHEDSLEAGSVNWVSDYEIEAKRRGLKKKTKSGSRNESYIFNCKARNIK